MHNEKILLIVLHRFVITAAFCDKLALEINFGDIVISLVYRIGPGESIYKWIKIDTHDVM